jgi:hypothetical protein
VRGDGGDLNDLPRCAELLDGYVRQADVGDHAFN